MLVVPIPLHRSKRVHRGFNQAQALATYAVASLHKSHPQWLLTLAPDTLLRQRATKNQAGLTTRQRRLNVRGAFAVTAPETVRDQDVLLIDDIYTTGATARAAAQALRRAGAASVWVATLARAHRISPIRSGSSALFEDADDNDNMTGNAPFPTSGHFSDSAAEQDLFQESIHSSHDQRSF
jgi:hypothetical protein